MLSLDECMKFVKGMAIACTAVGDVKAGERYNDILHYLERVPKITWVKIRDEVPSTTDNHYVTLFTKNSKTGESNLTVNTGWYEAWDEECGHWYLSDGFEYDWFSDEPERFAEDFSKNTHCVSHVVSWSREIPEFGIEPFMP